MRHLSHGSESLSRPRSRSDDLSAALLADVRGDVSRRGLAALVVLCAVLPAWQAGKIEGAVESVQAPTVRVEKLIRTRRDLGRGGLLRRITGRPDPEIFHRPYGVAWDGDDLLVTDPGSSRVVRIGIKGRISSSPQDAFESPMGVAVCGEGVVVTDSRRGRVELLDQRLRPVRRLAEDLDRPTGVACDPTHVFVVETGGHRVLVFPLDGGASERADAEQPRSIGSRGAAPGEFNFPTAIAFADDSIWIGDTLNFRIQRFDVDGSTTVSAFGELGDAPGEMPRIKGIAVDERSNLWVSDAHLDLLSLYRPDGRFLMSLGGNGSRAGEFSFPAGLATHPDGRVAVADSFNRRIQILRVVPAEKRGVAEEEKR